jgi:DNA-binding transcriptional LysR family regulator
VGNRQVERSTLDLDPLAPQRTGDLDLRAVRYFLVLAEELHFGRAARRLDLSRSGLSRSISALERQLALRLFVRSHGGLRLTTAGSQLARHGGLLVRMQTEMLHELGSLVAACEGDQP